MKKIYAIVTMYRPNISEFIDNIHATISQVSSLLILDNSENLDYYNTLQLKGIFNLSPKIRYFKMEKNLGLGAINLGVEIAKKEGADYVLLLDQDSTPTENMVNLMLEAYKKKEFSSQIAAIGPTMINRRTNETFKAKFKKGRDIDEDLAEVDQLPTSGMLIPIKIIDKIGKLCEDLFLDITDFEWCWRAKKEGFRIFRHKKAFLCHELGVETRKIWFIEYNIPSPERQYYLFRNSIFVEFCKYAPFYTRLRYAIMIPLKTIIYTFLDRKRERLKYTIKGIYDGIKKWVFGTDVCIPKR